MKSIISPFVLIACIALTACASVDVTKTAKGFHEATNPNAIEILKTRPNKAYEELGTITVTGFSPSETAKMHNAVRAKSAPLGANAVLLTEEGIVRDGWGRYARWATGVAIAYK